jgi:hypothetical protein
MQCGAGPYVMTCFALVTSLQPELQTNHDC